MEVTHTWLERWARDNPLVIAGNASGLNLAPLSVGLRWRALVVIPHFPLFSHRKNRVSSLVPSITRDPTTNVPSTFFRFSIICLP